MRKYTSCILMSGVQSPATSPSKTTYAQQHEPVVAPEMPNSNHNSNERSLPPGYPTQ